MKNNRFSERRRWAKSTLVLVPLFGAHYTLFLGLSYHKDHLVELVWLFCDQLFASFQVQIYTYIYVKLRNLSKKGLIHLTSLLLIDS